MTSNASTVSSETCPPAEFEGTFYADQRQAKELTETQLWNLYTTQDNLVEFPARRGGGEIYPADLLGFMP